MRSGFMLASMAVLSAMANNLPNKMGIEVIRAEGAPVVVQEVVSFDGTNHILTIRTKAVKPHSSAAIRCTNCVNVGGECTIGEGNCKTSQHAYCTDCGNGRIICVDDEGGSCEAPYISDVVEGMSLIWVSRQ